jgi:hypothetical protein
MASLRHKEKLRRALYYLAVGEGDVRERLLHAYNQIRVLREDEIPPGMLEELKGILKDMTRRGPLIKSSVLLKDAAHHTLGRMHKRTARRIAERIYRISIDL